MQPLPHHYHVQANSTPDRPIIAASRGIADMVIAGPREFDGPGDQWSPETLLVSAIASCFILSFQAVANASTFSWKSLQCDVQGTLDKVERTMKFTEITTKAKLVISDPAEKDKAVKLLQKADAICLVTNSLTAEVTLSCEIVVQA